MDGGQGAMFDSAIVTDDYCSGSRSNVGQEMDASSNVNAQFGTIPKRNAKSGVFSRFVCTTFSDSIIYISIEKDFFEIKSQNIGKTIKFRKML